MFSRRRFLGASGLGLAAVSAGCRPVWAETGGTSTAPLPFNESGRHRLLGYPINMNMPADEFFAWRDELAAQGIGTFAHNNVGNPFKPSPIPYNSHDYERKTIRAFGGLFGFPADDTWGFLSHSGTDSNLHGMYMGRTILQAKTGALPKVYFTREAHYSVQILADVLGLVREEVGTHRDGSMDPEDLEIRLSREPERPALVVATIGTTFKGAIDNIDQLQSRLHDHESYLHLDAALFGGYLPFTRYGQQVAMTDAKGSSTWRYDSIAVSCHKFFGFANPAGLFLTRQSIYDAFDLPFSRIHNPEYIHQVPGTITCSRDATKPAEFFYYTTPPARRQQCADAASMLENAAYLLGELNSSFPQLEARRANALSNTVYFRNPGESIVKKYCLATMNLPEERAHASTGAPGYAHVVVMPHVTREVLDEFLDDLSVA